MCLCTCNAFIQLHHYRTVSTMSSDRSRATDTRTDAVAFLNRGINVNLAQQRASSRHLAS